jgi:hypothetical protein
MKRLRIAAAAFAAAGLIPAAGAAAAPPASTAVPAAAAPLAAAPTPSGTWPADWVPFGDFTNTIAIAVPPTWRYVELMPATNDDGSARPWLAATPDMAGFLPAEGAPDTFAVPGVVMIAYPGAVDTLATLNASEYHSVCTAGAPMTFARGALAGHLQEFTGCGGTGSRILQIAATIPGAAHTYLLLVQLTGAEDDAVVLDGLLSSFSPIAVPAA